MYGRIKADEQAKVTVPRGEVQWLREVDQLPPDGPCFHRCKHEKSHVVAWGSTMLLYELAECIECQCRSWMMLDPYTNKRTPKGWMARKNPDIAATIVAIEQGEPEPPKKRPRKSAE